MGTSDLFCFCYLVRCRCLKKEYDDNATIIPRRNADTKASTEEDPEDEEFESYFDLEDFNDETIEAMIDDVSSSIDTLEDIMLNIYHSYHRLKEETDDRINKLVIENENYCETITKLYQELATISNKEKEE